MTQRTRNVLMDALNTSFRDIGTSLRPDKKKPTNVAAIAWEYFIAKHLSTLADGRKKLATKQAIEAGVIFDHTENPALEGEHGKIYEDDCITIMLSVNKPAERINADVLIKFLTGKVDAKILKLGIEAATFTARPAHEFKPILNSDP